MANTLNNLMPDIYVALNVVSRELVGFIPSVTRDTGVERAAVGETVRSHVVPAQAATNITPGVTPPNDGDQTIGNVPITLTKARRVPFRWNGEETKGMLNGPGMLTVQQDQIAQAFRTLANEIETDLAALQSAASRAYGTPGTVPFGTAGDYTDASNTLKILLDNGTPNNDLQMVINTAAGSNMRGKQGARVNEAGTEEILRRGVLYDIHGFKIRESAQAVNFVPGTLTGTVTKNGAGAIGDTVVSVATAAASAVNLIAGDVIQFAGDANQYVVAAAATIGASTTGNVTIAAPGLRTAVANASAVSVKAAGARNLAFRRSAIVLAQRLPALPAGGDLAIDRTTVSDPVSGLTFEIAMYPQYRQMQYEISAVWGVAAVKPEHMAILHG